MKQSWMKFPVFTVILLQVKADVIFDEYAGPYLPKPLGIELCPTKGFPCIDAKFNRRKLSGLSSSWLYNGTIRSYIYVKDTTTVRIVASTKGASGHYNSLVDITRPICKWLEWIKPFINDLAQHAGYSPNSCLAAIPGKYSLVNFLVKSDSHFRLSQIPIAPYGIYKIDFQLSDQSNRNCNCLRVFMELTPDAKAIRKTEQTLFNRSALFTN